MNQTMKWACIMLAVGLVLGACGAEEVEKRENKLSAVASMEESANAGHNEIAGHSHDEHEHSHEVTDSHKHEHDGHSHAAEEVHQHEDHQHSHAEDEEQKQIYAGYFEDDQIKDRELSDWAGDWQSVYPYLLDGTLDEVFVHKANHNQSKTAEQYKQYYEIGYQTTMDRIVITENKVTFYDGDQVNTGEYVYDGYEILTYEKGNRGVRYIFELAEQVEGLPKYIQFSDHSIYPTVADHYHLYWGDDRAALLEEVVNWPTYYPSSMDGHTIAHEMMAH